MKTIFLTLISVVIFAVTANAVETKANYFVKSTGELTNCKKIHFKTNSIKVVLENGVKMEIAKDQIKAIKVNNTFYEKLPVYLDNKNTGNEELMQFVATRAGLKLYKFSVSIDKLSGLKGFNVNGFNAECYVVFKGDQFHVAITDKNYPTMFQFFGISYTEK